MSSTTTTTTTTTRSGVTTTTTVTVTQSGLSVAFDAPSSEETSAAAAKKELELPRGKDEITAEWLTRAMRSQGSLPESVEVIGLEVTYLKGEDDKGSGGVAQALAASPKHRRSVARASLKNGRSDGKGGTASKNARRS